jgi:hypothetical protein
MRGSLFNFFEDLHFKKEVVRIVSEVPNFVKDLLLADWFLIIFEIFTEKSIINKNTLTFLVFKLNKLSQHIALYLTQLLLIEGAIHRPNLLGA